MYYVGKTKLRILVDPFYIHHYSSNDLLSHSAALSTALAYLNGISECPVSIEFIYPKYIEKSDWKENVYSYIPNTIGLRNSHKFLTIINEKQHDTLPQDTKPFLDTLISFIHNDSIKDKYKQNLKLASDAAGIKKLLEAIQNGSLDTFRDFNTLYSEEYRDILDLYFRYGCDFILTGNKILTAEKQILAKKYQLFVVDYIGLRQEIGIFLKGHNIYIDAMASVPIYGLQLPTFYTMTDANWFKYQALWSILWQKSQNTKMSEYLRVALFHRYTFLKYSVDQIKFHNQLAERLVDDTLRTMHHFYMSYHLNAFYLNLWGFLDNIAWAFNYHYNLGYTEDASAPSVSFSKKEFKSKLGAVEPTIGAILASADIKKWLDSLALKRHPAAHREPLFMSPILDKNTNELLSETHVVIKKGDSTSIFESISHVTYDLGKLQEFMDKICQIYKVPVIKNPFS